MDDAAKQTWVDKQLYIALGNIMTVCANMHIDSCPVEWFIPSKYDEILSLADKGLSSVVLLPIGYRDNSDQYAQLKKVRFPTQDILEII